MHALLASRAEFFPIWCAKTPGQESLKLLLSFPVDLRSYEQPEIGHEEQRSLHRRRTPLGGGKRQNPGSGAQKIGGGSLSRKHKAWCARRTHPMGETAKTRTGLKRGAS